MVYDQIFIERLMQNAYMNEDTKVDIFISSLPGMIMRDNVWIRFEI